jgi:hypothetical protein
VNEDARAAMKDYSRANFWARYFLVPISKTLGLGCYTVRARFFAVAFDLAHSVVSDVLYAKRG